MKEASLSEILLQQMKSRSAPMNLSKNAPVLSDLPPFLLKEIPEEEFREIDFHFEEFSTPQDLKRKYPLANLKSGHPHEIFRFLENSQDVYLDFGSLGCVLLSGKASGTAVKKSRMCLWLTYALSPELWGPAGKWQRFHVELHNLFEKHKLLEANCVPGYYPLKTNAWKKSPFLCDTDGTTTTLVLPWTFSLSDLRRLSAFFDEEK